MNTAFLFIKFHCLQAFRQRPWHCFSLIASGTILVVSGGFWLGQTHAREAVANDLRLLVVQQQADSKRAAQSTILPSDDHDLPLFSSADTTARFHAAASDVSLPINEVLFALDASKAQPYLRYRITLSVKTGYPQIRKFVAALAAELPNASLDNVRCAREETALTVLSCDLVFSAFFKKTANG